MRERFRYDVIVCGAGIAGVAAALAAARAGRSVALVEKSILPGGLATSGLVNIYLPLCDGNGTQVTYGLAEELLRASIAYGPGAVPACWDDTAATKTERFRTAFNPASFALALDELLVSAGVTLWLDTLACLPVTEGTRLIGVEVETKAGRQSLTAPYTIDATGDADIASRANAPCVSAPNIMSLWALQTSLGIAAQAVAAGNGDPLLAMYRHGGDAADPETADPERAWLADSAQAVTAFVLEGRKILLESVRRAQAAVGRANTYPLTLPTMAQYRMTRRIVGESTIQPGDAWQRVPDAIGLVADWRCGGSVWEIPYRSLLPQGINGLLVVGRCIAAAGDAWHVTRVIPAAALTGQVAGLAATLLLDDQCDPIALDVARLQQALHREGIPCTLDEMYAQLPI